MSPRSFFGELKRRNVIRMAGLYLVGAWLVVQVAGTVLPMFGAPEWLPRSIVVLLAIGFVPALMFSWVFEITPEGLKREEDVERGQSITAETGRRMDRIIIVALVLALGYFALDKFVLSPGREVALVATAVRNESRPVVSAKSILILVRWRAGSDSERPGADCRPESDQPDQCDAIQERYAAEPARDRAAIGCGACAGRQCATCRQQGAGERAVD